MHGDDLRGESAGRTAGWWRGVFAILVLALAGCDFRPFGPWARRTYVPPGVQRLSTEIVGTLIPHRNQIYGCRWKYEPPEPNCWGFWIQDLRTGEILPVRDTDRVTGNFTPSIDGRYVVYVIVERDTFGRFRHTYVRVLLEDPWQVVDSIDNVPGGGAVPSPRDPDVFYVVSLTQWGEVWEMWRLNFRQCTVTQETTFRWPKGAFVLPGKLGDSVVVMDSIYTLRPVNYAYHWVYVDMKDRRFPVILDYRTGRRYRLDVDVSALEYAIFSGLNWVQGRDSMLIVMNYGGWVAVPEEIHTWLIPNVSDRLVPLK